MNFLINNTNTNDRSELQSKQTLERDLVCLSLDGFRRAARLCCDLGMYWKVYKDINFYSG